MKKNYIYLAGPMEGVTEEYANSWRQQATDTFENAGLEVLDPCRRTLFRDQHVDRNICNRIFKLDLQDIANSTVVLADMRASTTGKGWGTAMELMFAQTKNKTIIVWTDKDQFPHPFVNSIATEIHESLEEALDAVNWYYQ